MKLFIGSFIALFFLMGTNIFANDTLVQKESGGNLYKLAQSDTISIEKEFLRFDYYKNYYEVTIDYVFANSGNACILSVGFPEIQYINYSKDIPEVVKISNFRTWVDGEESDIQKVPADIDMPNDNEKIASFYKKEVHFAGNQSTSIKVSYRSDYKGEMGLLVSEYILGTAITWSGIRKLIVTYALHDDSIFLIHSPFFTPEGFNSESKKEAKQEDGIRLLEISYDEPVLFLDSKLRAGLGGRGDSWIFGIFFDYEYELKAFTKFDFLLLTKAQLKMARNCIYAWHGYKFKDPIIQQYFEKTAWYEYRKTKAYSESDLNEYERRNLSLIMDIEIELNSK